MTAVQPSEIATTAAEIAVYSDTARYVFSASAQGAAAIFAVVVTLALLLSQSGRYRIPPVLLIEMHPFEGLYFVLAGAATVVPLALLNLQAWSLSPMAIGLLLVTVVLTPWFVRSAVRKTDPRQHLAKLPKHMDAATDLALQAYELHDDGMVAELFSAALPARVRPLVLFEGSFLRRAMGVPVPSRIWSADRNGNMSAAYLELFGRLMLHPRTSDDSSSHLLLADLMRLGTMPQLPDIVRLLDSEPDAENSLQSYVRSSPFYAAEHLEQLSNQLIGFSTLPYSYVIDVMGMTAGQAIADIMRSLLLLQVAQEDYDVGKGLTDSEINALFGLRDALLMLDLATLQRCVPPRHPTGGGGIAIPGSPLHAESAAANRLVWLIVYERVHPLDTSWPWLIDRAGTNQYELTNVSGTEILESHPGDPYGRRL